MDVSPDPFANRAHMSAIDVLSLAVEARYQRAEAVGTARTEVMQLAARQERHRPGKRSAPGMAFSSSDVARITAVA